MTGEIARCDINNIEILSNENLANEFNFISVSPFLRYLNPTFHEKVRKKLSFL